MSTFPPSHSTVARDRSRAMRPWLVGDVVQESKPPRKQIEIRDVFASELHQSSWRRVQPYHKETQSGFATAASRAKLRSRPNTAPSLYNHDTASPILDISPTGFSTLTPIPWTSHTNISSIVSSQHYTPGADAGYNSSSAHRSTPSGCAATTSTIPNGEHVAGILQPIKSSVSATKDGSKDQSRQRKISLPSHGSRSDGRPLPPFKRDVLKSPRGPRSMSSTTTLPLAPRVDDSSALPSIYLASTEPFVDTELRKPSRPKPHAAVLLSPNLNRSLSRERPLPPLPTRPHTSSGHPSPRIQPEQTRIKRPTTAPAAYAVPFDENRLPTERQLSEAASLFVLGENGVQVPFGNLFLGAKTVVIFIRHFWCPLCQDYMTSISRNVNPAVLKRAGVNFVIISNGSRGMIKSYRQIFRTPFSLYIDSTHRVYKALGMTLRTLDPGPDSKRGGYVRHGLVGGISMVVKNAIKTKMPVWNNGGDIEQLGGEFVLGPGLKCTFAHRMRTTRSHTPIQRVLAAAGVDVCARGEKVTSFSGAFFMSDAEEAQWMEERNKSLAKLKEKKNFRRGGEGLCGFDGGLCQLEEGTADPVRIDDPPASPTSSGTCLVDNEVGITKIIDVSLLSNAILGGVTLKEDDTVCWHAKDHLMDHSVEIFPGSKLIDTNSSLSLSSGSDSSFWNYYLE